MANNDRIRVTHPETGGVFETTRVQYEQVWKQRGWSETFGDTPLTDWRYQDEGGGEVQPAPLTQPETTQPTNTPSPTQPAPTE